MISLAYSSQALEFLIFLGGIILFSLGANMFYFAKWESGSGRATLGKWSLGLIVVREDNEPMEMGQAIQRTIMAFITYLLGYIPFFISAFHPEKRAMHDLVSKSKVV